MMGFFDAHFARKLTACFTRSIDAPGHIAIVFITATINLLDPAVSNGIMNRNPFDGIRMQHP